LVKGLAAALPLLDHLRLKGAEPVPGNGQFHRPILAQHRLGTVAIAVIAGGRGRRPLPLGIAQMGTQLGVQQPFNQPLAQTVKRPARSKDIIRTLATGQQLIHQLRLAQQGAFH